MAQALDRRLLISVGGGLVVLAVAVGGALYVLHHDEGSKAPPPASTGGLVVQMGRSEDAKIDPGKTLRCFVNGQFVGLETLPNCAKKNGVAAGALDVGVDQTGALAAAGRSGAAVTPLPPSDAAEAAIGGEGAQRGPVGECWRYSSGEWRKAGDGMALSACVQLLFAGRCESPGGASYGRWMGQTVRLVPHRVEISSDNMNFRTVVQQSDTGCGIPNF
jgi:hypothetical protein